MKALDTNVLVRFLVNDDEAQARIVYDLFKSAEAGKKAFWVPLLVVLDILWVLESVYEIPRQEVLDSLNELLLMPILKFKTRPPFSGLFFQRKIAPSICRIVLSHALRLNRDVRVSSLSIKRHPGSASLNTSGHNGNRIPFLLNESVPHPCWPIIDSCRLQGTGKKPGPGGGSERRACSQGT